MAVPVLLLLAAMASIQVGAAIAKQLFPIVGPGGATALRLFFAAVILCTLWRPWNSRLTRDARRTIFLYGAALGGMNLTFYFAVERIPLGIAVALEFVGPLTVAFIASRRALDVLWGVLAAAGIVLILPAWDLSTPLDPLGVVLALVAGACWGLYIWYGQRAGRKASGRIATSWGMVAAMTVALPFGVASSGARLLDSTIILPGIAVAVLSSALPYSLEMVALKRLPPQTFGILMSLEPAFAAVSGLLLLGESLTPTQWGAILLVILGSAGVTWRPSLDYNGGHGPPPPVRA